MAVPETDLARIQRWAARRVPEHVRDQVWIELDVDARSVTIFECRSSWAPDLIGPEPTRFPIARLRYLTARREWELFWRDRNSRFHRYDLAPPSPIVERLLEEIDADRTAIFWG